MKTRLGTVIVTILAILGGFAGFAGAAGYFSFLGALQGFVAACHTLQMGEAKELITKAQRAEIAKVFVPTGKDDKRFPAYFATDCSKLPY